MNLLDVLLLHLAEYDYNVDVREREYPFRAEQDHVCGTLETVWCDAKSKWRSYDVIETLVGYGGSLIFVCVNNYNLPAFTIIV